MTRAPAAGLVDGRQAGYPQSRGRAGDEELGRIIAQAGRETVAPLITRVFDEAASAGDLVISSAEEATEIFLGVVVGDMQIRRVVGRAPALDAEAIEGRSLAMIHQLWGRG